MRVYARFCTTQFAPCFSGEDLYRAYAQCTRDLCLCSVLRPCSVRPRAPIPTTVAVLRPFASAFKFPVRARCDTPGTRRTGTSARRRELVTPCVRRGARGCRLILKHSIRHRTIARRAAHASRRPPASTYTLAPRRTSTGPRSTSAAPDAANATPRGPAPVEPPPSRVPAGI